MAENQVIKLFLRLPYKERQEYKEKTEKREKLFRQIVKRIRKEGKKYDI